jgi:putative inorganic carbon (HCO3(-)) transporter
MWTRLLRATATTTRVRSGIGSALPTGLRIRNRRRYRIWVGVAGLILVGTLLGASLNQDSNWEFPVILAAGVAITVLTALTLFRPALGVALLAFGYPFDIATKAGPVKLTTSAALMAILVVVWLVRQGRTASWPWRATPLDLPVLAFAGATVLSLLGFAGQVDHQLVGVLKAFGGFLIYFIVTQTLETKQDVWLVLGAVVASGLIQAAWLTVQVLSGGQVVSDTTRATGSVIDPNIFAGYLILLIPLVVAVGLSLRATWSVAVTALAFILLAFALVATLSRSGWLGLSVATIGLAILLPKERWKVLFLVGGVGAALLSAGLVGPIAARLGPGAQGPTEILVSRWNVWTAAALIFIQHPIFGVGVMNLTNYLPSNSIPGTEILNDAHNIFLNMAAERGVIGLATFVFFVFVLFRTLRQVLPATRSRLDYALVAGLLATFAGYFAHSLFEVSYYDYKVLLLFWLLVGVVASLPRLMSRVVEVDLGDSRSASSILAGGQPESRRRRSFDSI